MVNQEISILDKLIVLGGKRELLGGGSSSVGHVLKKSKDSNKLYNVCSENMNQFFTLHGCVLYKTDISYIEISISYSFLDILLISE